MCLQSDSNRFWLYFYFAWCFSVFSNFLDDKHGLFLLSENKILILKALCLFGGKKSLKILHITFPEEKNNKKLPGELGSRSMACLGKQKLELSCSRAEHRVAKTEVPEAQSTILGSR